MLLIDSASVQSCRVHMLFYVITTCKIHYNRDLQEYHSLLYYGISFSTLLLWV